MTTTEKRQLEQDVKELKAISERINKLGVKYDFIRYSSNYNLLINSMSHVSDVLEDINNENN
jgi:hypothetical protein